MKSSAPRVSVVVPTFQRRDLLERCLTALVAQSLGPDDYEVIVVDDAVRHETLDFVSSIAKMHRRSLRAIIPHKHSGPAAARNFGWKAAQAKIIAFTDDDTVPDPYWLENGLARFSDPYVVALRGRVVMPIPSPATDYAADAAGLEKAEFVTANCFVRRELLEELGGFDERFGLAWREDSDLHFSILRWLDRRKGSSRIEWADDAVVVHPLRSARWGVSVFQQRKAMFNALLYKKHPEQYRRRIQALPPLGYYVILGFWFLALFGVIKGAQIWIVSGLAGAMISTLRFTYRRLRDRDRSFKHVFEMLVTSFLIPPIAIYWRLRGAIRFRVLFF